MDFRSVFMEGNAAAERELTDGLFKQMLCLVCGELHLIYLIRDGVVKSAGNQALPWRLRHPDRYSERYPST
jgi:hypothetical protein